jgi:prophage regulatory protein
MHAKSTHKEHKEVVVIREPDRRRITGLSRIQWWRLEKLGRVPRRIQLGTNSVGWLRHELEAWIAKRAADRAPRSAA